MAEEIQEERADCVIVGWDCQCNTVVYWNRLQQKWHNDVDKATLYPDSYTDLTDPSVGDTRYISVYHRRLPDEAIDRTKGSVEQRNQAAAFSYLKIMVSETTLYKAVLTMKQQGASVCYLDHGVVMNYALSSTTRRQRNRDKHWYANAQQRLHDAMCHSAQELIDKSSIELTEPD